MDPTRLAENLENVRRRIAEAASRSGRSPAEITLVAVTKRRSGREVRALAELGVREFGENYPQELWEKAAEIPVSWHLIGHLQGNKAKRTVPLVTMIHGVDSLKLLKTLDEIALSMPDPPSVFLQVNGSGEEAKHGWSPDSLIADAEEIASRGAIPIVGLMTMAGYDTDAETARPTFRLVRELRDLLRERTGLALPHLSMGMSGDFPAAIEEEATFVRVGSALFEGIAP